MNEIDREFQTAWDSGQPLALHTACERFAARGVQRADLEASLTRLLQKVRLANEDEERDEMILTVMDRLAGWCAPNRRIAIPDASVTAIPLPAAARERTDLIDAH